MPIQTLIDLGTELSPNRLERAVNEADKLDLVDPESLRAALEERAGEPGVRPLRELLDGLTFRLSDSELEARFRRLAAAAGLPPPLTKHPLNGFEVDFYWPDFGLVVETDGFRYHRTVSAQTRDALRDQTHTAAGLTALRFSHRQVRHEPARVTAVLKRTAARLETPAAAGAADERKCRRSATAEPAAEARPARASRPRGRRSPGQPPGRPRQGRRRR